MLVLINYKAFSCERIVDKYVELVYNDDIVDKATITNDLIKFDPAWDRKNFTYKTVDVSAVYVSSKFSDNINLNVNSVESMKKIIEISDRLNSDNYCIIQFDKLAIEDIQKWINSLSEDVTFTRIRFTGNANRYLVVKCTETDVILNVYKSIISGNKGEISDYLNLFIAN